MTGFLPSRGHQRLNRPRGDRWPAWGLAGGRPSTTVIPVVR